ncbi:unnamed protein product [Ascophyllum nodosum]
MKTTAVLLIYSLSVVPTECFAPSNVVPAIASGASHNSKGFSPTRISASAAPIAWPDVRPTPSLDQPIRARIVAVAPEDMASPFKDREQAASWFEVWEHIARRVKWADPGVDLKVFREESLSLLPRDDTQRERLREALGLADVFLGCAIQDAPTAEWISGVVEEVDVRTRFVADCPAGLDRMSRVGNFRPEPPAPPLVRMLPDFLRDVIGGADSGTAKDRKLWDTLKNFYERNSSEDLTFLSLVLVDSYTTRVPRVTGISQESGSDTLDCMLSNCREEVFNCAKNPQCRACISCLEGCPPNDQVCAYRCITSYETESMEKFSLCVLQKNNCMGKSAEIPALPDPTVLARFRGQELTHDVAQDIFVGWLGRERFSWKVVCGQNPAYDFFPSQHQIFYRGKGQGVMWYDPVFKVFTVKDEEVWRRRHYRVKSAATPGTFRFSVLDNGVVSNEYWRIIDVPDDLSWGVFYYAGAAAAAGQSYTGALLVTRDGSWPGEGEIDRIRQALDTCGIKLWELFEVDNSNDDGAPLGLPHDFAENNRRPTLV